VEYIGRVMAGRGGDVSVIPLSQHVARGNGNHASAMLDNSADGQ